MKGRFLSAGRRLLRADLEDWMGMLTWGAVFAITLYIDFAHPKLEMPSLWLYSTLFVGYVVAYLFAIAAITERLVYRALGVFTMLVMAFLLGWYVQLDYLPILTIIWAAVVAYYLPFKTAVFVVVATVVVWFVMMSIRTDNALVVQGILYLTFHIFSVMLASSNVKLNQYATQLKQKNNQLMATQYLLGQASKDAERNRIARDIHDVVGHHLTALSIKLQVLSKTTEGSTKEEVDSCHQISKLLLSDVRSAVTDLRQMKDIDFNQALSLLTQGLPGTEVVVELQDGLVINQIEIAEPLLKIIQESITNTMKHSKASNIWIRISKQENDLSIHIQDNGGKQSELKLGNGLTGIQERIHHLGGTVTFSMDEVGFHTQAQLKGVFT